MTNEEAIEWLKDEYEHARCDECIEGEYVNALELAIKALGIAKWIPVSERLPEESFRSVIGWDRYRKCCVLVQYWRGEFQVAGTVASFDIVAWQPLPQPYKAESEDEE